MRSVEIDQRPVTGSFKVGNELSRSSAYRKSLSPFYRVRTLRSKMETTSTASARSLLGLLDAAPADPLLFCHVTDSSGEPKLYSERALHRQTPDASVAATMASSPHRCESAGRQ